MSMMVFLTKANSAPAGISAITAEYDEIQLIDLKNRRSVEH